MKDALAPLSTPLLHNGLSAFCPLAMRQLQGRLLKRGPYWGLFTMATPRMFTSLEVPGNGQIPLPLLPNAGNTPESPNLWTLQRLWAELKGAGQNVSKSLGSHLFEDPPEAVSEGVT